MLLPLDRLTRGVGLGRTLPLQAALVVVLGGRPRVELTVARAPLVVVMLPPLLILLLPQQPG